MRWNGRRITKDVCFVRGSFDRRCSTSFSVCRPNGAEYRNRAVFFVNASRSVNDTSSVTVAVDSPAAVEAPSFWEGKSGPKRMCRANGFTMANISLIFVEKREGTQVGGRKEERRTRNERERNRETGCGSPRLASTRLASSRLVSILESSRVESTRSDLRFPSSNVRE